MRIEFVGLPGAGKSYLCRTLGCWLASNGDGIDLGGRVSPSADEQNWIWSQLAKLFGASGFVIRHPLEAFRIAGVVQKSGQRSKRHMVTKSLNLLAELGRFDSPRNGLISDQGVLQAVWSIALHARRQVIDELLGAARPWLPTAAIRVDVGRSELIRRLGERERGHSRFDRLQGEDLAKALDRSADLLGDILRTWENMVPTAKHVLIENPRGSQAADVLSPVIRLVCEDHGEVEARPGGESQS